jgi:hypothetical protein
LIVLVFERGNIVARGGAIPHGKYESRTDSYVAPAFRYSDIIEHLEENEIEYRDEVFEGLSCPRLGSSIKLRDYQEKALGAWRKANNRGLIVLPTGAGKTVRPVEAAARGGVRYKDRRRRGREQAGEGRHGGNV